MLEEGKIDCMILASVDETSGFIEVPVYDEPMVLAVPKEHKWAEEKSIDMSRLNGESVLMLGDGHCLRDQALGFCFAAGAKDDDHFKATSLETLRNMVAAGGGITLMPYLTVPKEKERDGICYLPAKAPVPHRQIVLAYRPGSPLKTRYEALAKEIESKMAEVIH
jgi:LysR family hydrogen peroxide-inducible transcriptional activator